MKLFVVRQTVKEAFRGPRIGTICPSCLRIEIGICLDEKNDQSYGSVEVSWGIVSFLPETNSKFTILQGLFDQTSLTQLLDPWSSLVMYLYIYI